MVFVAALSAGGAFSPDPARADGPRVIARILEEAFARRLLLETRTGRALLRDATGSSHITDSTYTSFMQRLSWREGGPLHDELAVTIERLRGEAGRLAEIPAAERLVTEDARRLEQLARELRTPKVDGFITELVGFVHVPSPIRPAGRSARGARPATIGATRERFVEGAEESVAAGARAAPEAAAAGRAEAASAEPVIPGEDIPELPVPATDTLRPDSIDVRAASLGWRRRIAMSFRNHRNFFSALFAERHWRNLFRRRAPYTVDEVVQIRRLARLTDALNNYAQMRIMIKSFARESPVLYTELNERTADSLRQFLEGRLDIEGLVAARATVANELRLNEVVTAAERRMLTSIQRLKELGGSVKAGEEARGLVDFAEENFVFYTQRIELLESRAQAEAAVQRLLEQSRSSLRGNEAAMRTSLEARAADLEGAGTDAGRGAADRIRAILADGAPVRDALGARIGDARRGATRAATERDLWVQRRAKEADDLKRFYLEFVEHYETLDIFINLRRGRINSESVRAFDMPEPFVVPGDQVQGWAPHYERALFNSTNELVVGETRLYFQTRVGRTRSFIREMNKLTEKYFGKRFTQTETGREFVRYQRHVINAALRRVAMAAGVAVPPALAAYGDDVANWIEAFLNGEEPAPRDPNAPAPSGDGTSRPTGGTDPAPAPAPAPDEDPTPRPSRRGSDDSRPRRTPAPPASDPEPAPAPAGDPAPAPGPVDTGEPAPPSAPGDLFPNLGG